MNNSRFGMMTLLWLTATLAMAQETPEQGAAAKLAAILQQTETLSADVEQLLLDQDGREVQETRAHLLMRKPSAFRWEVREPYEELTVTDGSLLWRYEPDLEQVTIKRFNDALDRTPVMLLNADAATIAETYEVSATFAEDGLGANFVLLPRQPDSLFERLSLSFTGAELTGMHFEDSLGQLTSLSFTALVRNQPLATTLFEFTPPPDVEVIDSSTAASD